MGVRFPHVIPHRKESMNKDFTIVVMLILTLGVTISTFNQYKTTKENKELKHTIEQLHHINTYCK